jgi:hypothetical protein
MINIEFLNSRRGNETIRNLVDVFEMVGAVFDLDIGNAEPRGGFNLRV